MAGATPKYKIPYATSSDAINQGAIAMQNMANRIELILSNAGVPVPAALLTVDDPPADDAGA